ncbi:hypothetical protein [Chelatococcus sp. XZ-Ab1]|uniref:hypothetical protein n=1 Tax=Chelatococcus sp. XZ-Ab1 TaxID=3034027 RepID=UPI0023E3C425|nr:hypothetical protein [Chelatococcus sp. XZ-Ab1]
MTKKPSPIISATAAFDALDRAQAKLEEARSLFDDARHAARDCAAREDENDPRSVAARVAAEKERDAAAEAVAVAEAAWRAAGEMAKAAWNNCRVSLHAEHAALEASATRRYRAAVAELHAAAAKLNAVRDAVDGMHQLVRLPALPIPGEDAEPSSCPLAETPIELEAFRRLRRRSDLAFSS